jgi:hypothetical protein
MDSAGLSAERTAAASCWPEPTIVSPRLLETTKLHQILKNYPTAADAEASVRT